MWYYIDNGQIIGPIPFEELVNRVNLGQVKIDTIVWQSGQRCLAAGQIPELSAFFHQEPFNTSTSSTSPIQAARSVAERAAGGIVNQLRESTGVGQTEGFSLKELFSETFKKHTDDEMESYFGVGTPATTPDLSQVNASWPKPWFFWRLILFGLLGFFLLWQGYTKWDNSNCAPGAIFFGSFAIPMACVMFFFECNVLKNISLYQIIKLFFYGGIFGLLIALIGFDFMPFAEQLGATQAGIVEEPAKLLVLIFVLKMGGLANKNYILNGLLCGAAVGAGFAAFESAGYAFSIFGEETIRAGKEMLANKILYGVSVATNDPRLAMYDNLVLRGLLSPFGHIIWTAMCAAALWRVKGDQEFEFSMLLKPAFLTVFAIAVALHMTWNSTWFYSFGFYPRFLALGAIGWMVIFGLMGIGLRQVRQQQNECSIEEEPHQEEGQGAA